MTTDQVLERITDLSGPITVTLSGGNPAIQDFGPLISEGRDLGYAFACETQGSIAPLWFADLDNLILSPKPPSSKMEPDFDVLDDCVRLGNEGRPGIEGTALKIVVFDEMDYRWARKVAACFPEQPLFLQVGNTAPPNPDGSDPGYDALASLAALRKLMERVCSDQWTRPRVLPQLHALAFGNARGV